jgi:hypothetical protein
MIQWTGNYLSVSFPNTVIPLSVLAEAGSSFKFGNRHGLRTAGGRGR